jgi:predicted outer membrane repeat protein
MLRGSKAVVVLTILLLAVSLTARPAQSQIYVKADATGAGDGSSWADAFPDLQDAIAAATGGDEIWVAAGTYTPSDSTDRLAFFQLFNNVAIYGGFAGTETMLDQRDPGANLTILSGDIGVPSDSTDNSYHVVRAIGADATAILDGFTITDGNADTFPQDSGGGIYVPAGATLRNLAIIGNTAASSGGAIYACSQNYHLENTVVQNNTAGGDGGGVANVSCSPTLVNVLITGNTAGDLGGAIHNFSGANPQLTNCTIQNNTAFAGGAIANETANPVVTNTIIWGNIAQLSQASRSIYNVATSNPFFEFSLVQDSGGSGAGWNTTFGTDGGDNIDGLPWFVDEGGGDLRLLLQSPCIDTGDNGAPGLATLDLDGNPRISNGTVDMGVYELPITCPVTARMYVDATATGAGDGTSWPDAFNELRDALAIAHHCIPAVTEIWVATGTYVSTPQPQFDQEATFLLVDGVALYGGFAGTETMLGERNILVNETILDGVVTYHVVTNKSGSTTLIDGFTIENGFANGGDVLSGGGILNEGGTLTVANVTFRDNYAFGLGGAVHSEGGTLIMSDVSFNTNQANKGGAVAGDNATVSITGAAFNANVAGPMTSSRGGALYFDQCDVEVTDAAFSDNTAYYGGAVYSQIGSNTSFTNAFFSGNQAEHSGGAINTSGNPITLADVTFQNNSAMNYDGGAWYNFVSAADVTNAVFLTNTCGGDGGAVYNLSKLTMANALFSGNAAMGSGGGIYNAGTSAKVLTNVSMANNGAAGMGGAILNDNIRAFLLTNSILWGNGAPIGMQLKNLGPIDALNIVSYCDIQGSGGSTGSWNPSELGNDGGFNIDADPMFVDQPGADLHLTFGSPAIDAGDDLAPALPPTDLDGNARIMALAVDMGAYEFPLTCPPAPVLYIDADATGSQTGASWADAFVDLQSGLNSAEICPGITEVWVAAGTYKPTAIGDRSATFQLRNGVTVYGGFAGTETMVDQRDIVANPTILSGELGNAGAQDNSYHVVTGSGTNASAVLDGFTIRRGNANGAGDDGNGGGIFVMGGSPTLRNLVVIDNLADVAGGGAFHDSSAPMYTNVRFESNFATLGAGMYNLNSGPALTNVVFVDNFAASQGGGMYNLQSSPSLLNVTFGGNTALTGGGAIYYLSSSTDPPVTNSIVYGNLAPQVVSTGINKPVFGHSLIEGSGGSGGGWDASIGFDGGNNIDDDPLFANLPGNDLHLTAGSPAVDAGDSGAPGLPTTDIDGNPRIVGADVDMGAYEFDQATAIGDDTPRATALRAIYPNPFNPTVTIAFDVDAERAVSIAIYDVQGKLVRELVAEKRPAGQHVIHWSGTDARGESVASGVYLVRLRSGGRIDVRKVVLLK